MCIVLCYLITCVDLCNHCRSQDELINHEALPHPTHSTHTHIPPSYLHSIPNRRSPRICFLNNNSISIILCKWTHTLFYLLRFTFFFSQRYAIEIHPSCWHVSVVCSFYHCMVFVEPFICWRAFGLFPLLSYYE